MVGEITEPLRPSTRGKQAATPTPAARNHPPVDDRPPPPSPSEASSRRHPSIAYRRHPPPSPAAIPGTSKQPPLSVRHHAARRSLRPVPLVDEAGSRAIRGKWRADEPTRRSERMRQAAEPVGADEPMRTAWAYEASKQDGPRGGAKNEARGETSGETPTRGMTRRGRSSPQLSARRRLCFRLHR